MSQNLPLVSIIVNNYNYGRFICQAIESALNQTYTSIEIIVVDDGSTDNSREIITSYEGKIISIFNENGGQASAINAGFTVSKGEIVVFLDADDFLLPEAVSSLVKHFNDPDIVKCNGPLLIVDQQGNLTGYQVPSQILPEGDLRELILQHGPESYVCSPTSGNAWSRKFLDWVLPIPEKDYRTSADAYLFTLVPLFGKLARINTPIGMYRVHSDNNYWQKNFDLNRLRHEIERYENRVKLLAIYAQKLGCEVNYKLWQENNRYYLARLYLLGRLSNLSPIKIPFMNCLRSSINAKINPIKRVLWVIWFLGIRFGPHCMVLELAKWLVKMKLRKKKVQPDDLILNAKQ